MLYNVELYRNDTLYYTVENSVCGYESLVDKTLWLHIIFFKVPRQVCNSRCTAQIGGSALCTDQVTTHAIRSKVTKAILTMKCDQVANIDLR